MKKLTWVLVLAVAIAAILVPAAAFANNGPHGNYVANTDMCAACHRAHTAPSSITWTDGAGAERNALLVTDATAAFEVCLACHDSGAQGAETNVTDGVYTGTKYGTQGADMISGAFGRADATKQIGALYDANGNKVTSTHLISGMNQVEGSWAAYGGGVYGPAHSSAEATGNDPEFYGTGSTNIVMTCTTCHDPHGTSNYRILKDQVYGVTVGGYTGGGTNPTPAPYVISNEKGFPIGGFKLHTAYPTYDPDYTVAQYAKAPANDPTKGMTNWCAGCHTVYQYDQANNWASQYNAADGAGFVTRHRHPMNVEMSTYKGPTALVLDKLPLAQVINPDPADSTVANGKPAVTDSDWLDCMTCHNAHGSTATMTGYADPNATIDVGDKQIGFVVDDSALLKMDNRGVCEACHNK